ncbi:MULTISPECIES: isocitrate lyase/phosphoenolpyruvate mutase family protein [Streptomyces]|uniref:isocitrate lyase/PEP mutase family protein n=1 Tax=Streptomyces TaxID=1883 RepID=UPI000F7985A1|nr:MULTISPECIES: isocitrate lyase/phosphoenolpyruvate mutase family protein [unclassified Streptomyces]QTI89770.1 isocitrate lyase/phosphoenolpyruvate mutase family protein [Streptomyces sp. AgN23]RSS35898.1 isocitrate lyase/phosphoenolpyruvate mutase family protein [Streptomyces sp. WAC05858]WTA85173.1 isocitrate lyase/phosphoenolpyruvate mutase family protein [Streptomyces antimycoticus]
MSDKSGAPAPDRHTAFRRLHHGERPLLLPNAWDHASAAALVRRGFPAIGTTSLGVAAAAGLPDATGAARDETLALARGIARLPALVSVDIEGGFSERPEEVAALAAELDRAGVAGVNIEDGRPDGTLAPLAHQCAVLAAVKERAPRLFVNARTDTHWLAAIGGGTPPSLSAAAERIEAYVRAGADGIFVPALTDEHDIGALADDLGETPLNILFTPGRHTYERLAELGVRRISCGSLLFRAALDRAVELAWTIAHPDAPAPAHQAADLLSYGEAQSLAEDFTQDVTEGIPT